MTRMNPSYTMTSSRFVTRGSRTRLFAYACFVIVLCALAYIFHGTQSQLDQVIQESDRCAQKTESLFTQLQGAIEYKLKLEKFLETEKENHKQEINEINASLTQLKESHKDEKSEMENQYNTLHDRFILLRNENKDLKEQNESVRKELLDQKEENSKLDTKLLALNSELTRMVKKNETIEELKQKLEQCQKKIVGVTDKGQAVAKQPIPDSLTVMSDKLSETSQNIINTSAVARVVFHPIEEDNVLKQLSEISQSIFNTTATPHVNPQAIDEDDVLKQSVKTSTATMSSINKAANNVGVAPLPDPNENIGFSGIKKLIGDGFNMGGGIQPKPETADGNQEENVGKSPNEEELVIGDTNNNINKNENVGERNSVDSKQNERLDNDHNENVIDSVQENNNKHFAEADNNQPNMFIPAPADFGKHADNEFRQLPLKDASHQKFDRGNAFGKHMKNEYRAGDYDKELVEEEGEEADEGEQEYIDNEVKQPLVKHVKPLPLVINNPNLESDQAEDSVIVQPK